MLQPHYNLVERAFEHTLLPVAESWDLAVLPYFGLAKGSPTQTASGPASSVFGYSLSFAPLEQMQGTGTDPRSDIYSLAATLYFLLTGVRPPDAFTRAAATVKHQPDPLRPAQLVQPQVPVFPEPRFIAPAPPARRRGEDEVPALRYPAFDTKAACA